jgi:hypothetical protein
MSGAKRAGPVCGYWGENQFMGPSPSDEPKQEKPVSDTTTATHGVDCDCTTCKENRVQNPPQPERP